MLKALYDFIERKFLIGKQKYQPIFESLHRISLRGMNYGQNHSVKESGEVWVINYLYKVSKGENTKPIIFDVGANKGQYVRELNKVFPFGSIHCFEPSPSAFSVLAKTVIAFDNVKCYNFGFGKEEAKLELKYSTEGSVMASFAPVFDETEYVNSSESRITTVDSFCEENSITEIFLLKIDVEGFEYQVLEGAFRLIRNKRIKYLQFEVGKNNIRSVIYLLHFFELLEDYTIYRVLKNGLREMKEYQPIYEVVLTTNYLAILNEDD